LSDFFFYGTSTPIQCRRARLPSVIRALEEDLIIWEVEQEPEQNDDEIQLKNPPITPIHFHWRDADVLCGLFWEAMLIMSFQVAIEYRGLKDQVIAQIK